MHYEQVSARVILGVMVSLILHRTALFREFLPRLTVDGYLVKGKDDRVVKQVSQPILYMIKDDRRLVLKVSSSIANATLPTEASRKGQFLHLGHNDLFRDWMRRDY